MGVWQRAKLEDDRIAEFVVDELQSRSAIGWGGELGGDLGVDDDLSSTLRLGVGLHG